MQSKKSYFKRLVVIPDVREICDFIKFESDSCCQKCCAIMNNTTNLIYTLVLHFVAISNILFT
jgi:hypothetical protein